MWLALIQLLRKIPTKDSTLLKALEPLFVAGFSSPHKAVVNETILFWNDTFGDEAALEYPQKLENVLRARVLDADISLPSFPASNDDHVPATLPAFYDSQSQLPPSRALPKLTNNGHHNANGSASQPISHSAYLTSRKSPFHQSTVSSPTRSNMRRSASSTPKARLRHDDSQIRFAPIESSPIPPTYESQPLTEHQREVKARQHETAQIFLDFSSSPVAQSTALPKPLPKRLDFTSEVVQGKNPECAGTPTAVPDASGLMSDELPSSPTPSSTRDTSKGVTALDDDEHEPENAQRDPPSSPPRATDDAEDRVLEPERGQDALEGDDATIEVADFAKEDSQRASRRNAAREGQQALRTAESELQEKSESDDVSHQLPADSQLPTLQLHSEEHAAEEALEPFADAMEHHERFTEARSEQSPTTEAETTHTDAAEGENSEPEQPNADGAESQAEQDEVTRVENSFIATATSSTEVDPQSTGGSQASQRPGRKRKRRSSTVYTTQKRKPKSPFKQFISNLWGQSQQQDDDDMGEDIVVASSQRSSSPHSNMAELGPSSPSNPAEIPSESVGEPVETIKEEQAPSTMPPPKRGRGRPRKSETPTQSQSEVPVTKSLKRRASTLSNASASESQVSSSFVKDTPAPSKARKQREGQDAAIVQSTQEPRKSERTITRTLSAVIVESTQPQLSENHEKFNAITQVPADDEDETNVLASAERQLAVEQAAAIESRPIATPRSILARLRNALTDFRGMILGSQEEREFDDVLFELRRETHEGGRRGREQGL